MTFYNATVPAKLPGKMLFLRALGWGLALAIALACSHLLSVYLKSRGMPINFGFLDDASGFDMSESLIEYSGDDSYARAFIAR